MVDIVGGGVRVSQERVWYKEVSIFKEERMNWDLQCLSFPAMLIYVLRKDHDIGSTMRGRAICGEICPSFLSSIHGNCRSIEGLRGPGRGGRASIRVIVADLGMD